MEWENIIFSSDDRCCQTLRELSRQISAYDRPLELLILFNPEQLERQGIEKSIHENFIIKQSEDSFKLRVEEAEGLHYFDLKNEGARRAHSPVIIFFDSDVIPEENWLKEISQPFFDNPEIKALAGNTYIYHESVYDKAFALGWFFPLRIEENKLHPNAKLFLANNVAFRRDTFLEHSFPALADGTTRGACTDLAYQLHDSNIPIWANTAARANHPAPEGFQYYIDRAMSHGRDNVLKKGRTFPVILKSYAGSMRWSFIKCIDILLRMLKYHQRVKLPVYQLPAAYAIMSGYYVLAAIASTVTVTFPQYAKGLWKI
ncbi:MAG: glycosyltransferase [Verrucomicrobiota bacterium]